MTKRLKKKLKRIVLALVVACATTMSVLAFTKVNTGLFVMPKNKNAEIGAPEIEKDISNIGELMAEIPLAEEANTETKETVSSNTAFTRIPNTATTTYIYDAKDLGDFRDSVNSGNDYAGKTVYLMRDIDLSTVCSSTLGSWTPIGVGTTFQGTFNGNYHKVKNLYINSASYVYLGLFVGLPSTATVQNLILDNVNIHSTYYANGSYSNNVGGIAGYSSGKIANCGVTGIIDGRQTQSVSGDRTVCVGGIVGSNSGTIESCYNRASISSYTHTSNNVNNSRTGGIAGAQSSGLIRNCYNKGSVTVQGARHYVGGIVGCFHGTKPVLQNSYNTGIVAINGSRSSTKKVGGIVGVNGDAAQYAGTISYTYCTTSSNAISYYYNGGNTTTSGRVALDTLKTYIVYLNNGNSYNNGYDYDVYNINEGYPVLKWENDKPKMEFTEKQVYIKTGENLKLDIVQEDTISELLGGNYSPENFTWTSTNEDVASVDNQGIVTGKSDRIYYGLCKK